MASRIGRFTVVPCLALYLVGEGSWVGKKHGSGNRVGHGFTDEPATRKMHAEFAAAAADVDAGHVLAEVPAQPAHVADLIEARAAAGSLRVERPT